MCQSMITPYETTVPLDSLSCPYCDSAMKGGGLEMPDGETYCDSDCAESAGFKQCADCRDWYDTNDMHETPEGEVCESCYDEYWTTCDDCDDLTRMQDTHWIDSEDRTVCESCLDSNYHTCGDCDSLVSVHDTTFIQYRGCSVCDSCRDSRYYECNGCHEWFHYEDMHGDFCDSCHDDREDRRIQDYSYRPTYKFNKTAEDKADHPLYMGIELEVEVSASICDACDTVERIDDLYMKQDSSIDNGFEIVSHPATLNYWQSQKERFATMLRALKDQGCDAEPQGLHVHISRGRMNEGHRIRFQSFFDGNSEIMPEVARRPSCYYAQHKTLAYGQWKKCADADEARKRYRAVNWQNVKTVEVRMFRGTLNIDEFMASIQFCHAVYQFTKSQISLATIAKGESWQPFCAYLRYEKRYADLVKYLKTRNIWEG